MFTRKKDAENAVMRGKNKKCKRLKILKEKVRNFPWHPEEGYNEQPSGNKTPSKIQTGYFSV